MGMDMRAWAKSGTAAVTVFFSVVQNVQYSTVQL